jgi:hypothetical protein
MDRHGSVFGYGSLVNIRTHAMAPVRPDRLAGWRRRWCYTAHRAGPYLSAVPGAAGDAIEGLIATVPADSWAALDAREAGYDRCDTPWPGVAVYAVPDPLPGDGTGAPILLSYLDAVLQGFVAVFGPEGPARFMATTDGWHIPIRNDRAAPAYPRAQRLTAAETALVDGLLRDIGARVLPG